MAFLFSKPPSLEEQVKKWKRELKHEERNLERNIRSIDLEEQKVIRDIKDRAKKGDKGSAKILAKELVRSRKAKERLYQSKAQLNSVSMQLTQNLAMVKVGKTMAKSTQIMSAMNNLVRLPQLQKVMVAMSKEMAKAEMIDEMMSDTLDQDVDEEEADEELDKVLDDILMGVKNAPVGAGKLPTQAAEETEDMSDLEKRLGALKA